MGFRFRRSIGAIPGVRLNFGKRGVSMSVGPRGAKMTIGPSGTRATVGMPGTGLSYTERLGSHHGAPSQSYDVVEQPPLPEYDAPPQRLSGSAALGWVVAAVLFVLLVLALS